jgi:hypothetical protein
LLSVGTVFIIGDLTMEPLLDAYQNRRAKSLPHPIVSRSAHSRLEWRAMSILQLQRMAHESIGSGTWLKATSETPITKPYQLLGMLDIRDKKRPLLRSKTDELVEWYSAPSTRASDADIQCEVRRPTTMKWKITLAKWFTLSRAKGAHEKEPTGEVFDKQAFGTRYFGFR